MGWGGKGGKGYGHCQKGSYGNSYGNSYGTPHGGNRYGDKGGSSGNPSQQLVNAKRTLTEMQEGMAMLHQMGPPVDSAGLKGPMDVPVQTPNSSGNGSGSNCSSGQTTSMVNSLATIAATVREGVALFNRLTEPGPGPEAEQETTGIMAHAARRLMSTLVGQSSQTRSPQNQPPLKRQCAQAETDGDMRELLSQHAQMLKELRDENRKLVQERSVPPQPSTPQSSTQGLPKLPRRQEAQAVHARLVGYIDAQGQVTPKGHEAFAEYLDETSWEELAEPRTATEYVQWVSTFLTKPQWMERAQTADLEVSERASKVRIAEALFEAWRNAMTQ
mmetsp:Transcript_54696/g.108839  ORF Transcript_54696/g.108839 Transcript_54696/m.108839 type:complete len:331 (+) Transcript_54696:67-1059(+)